MISVAKREGLGIVDESTTRLCCGSSTRAEARAAKENKSTTKRDIVRPLTSVATETECANFNSKAQRDTGAKGLKAADGASRARI